MLKHPRFYLPPILYVLLILFLSSLNQQTVVRYSFDLKDIVLHFLEYHFYGVLLIWGFLNDQPLETLKRAYGKAILAGSLTAIADEFYQSFVPSRFASIHDVFSDVAGVVCAILTFMILIRIPLLNRWRLNA